MQECPGHYFVDYALDLYGLAPWDGLQLEVKRFRHYWSDDSCRCAHGYHWSSDLEPMIYDDDGRLVDMVQEGILGSGEAAWFAEPCFEPGSYTLEGADGNFLAWNEPFVIEDWGRDEGFTPAAVEGRVYRFAVTDIGKGYSLGRASSLASSAYVEDGELFLEVGTAVDGVADFRILSRGEQYVWAENKADYEWTPYLCVALEDQAQLSETGEFFWSRAKLSLDTEPRLQAWDLSIHFGWDGTGERAGGLEASFLVDTYDLSAWVYESNDPVELCEDYGDCQACPQGEKKTCKQVGFTGLELELSEEVFDQDIEPCLFIFNDDMSSTWDTCGSCGAGSRGGMAGLLPLALLVLALRRRRAGACRASTSEPITGLLKYSRTHHPRSQAPHTDHLSCVIRRIQGSSARRRA